MGSDVYKNAKPLWANVLIIALVALVVAAIALAAAMWPLVWLMLAVVGGALIMAAIFALLKVRRSA